MNKDNIFKSSEFYMAKNDILHILIESEVGDVSIVLGGQESVSLVPGAVVALDASDIISGGFTANWQLIENADGYYFNLATDPDMTPHISGYDNCDVGNVDHVHITGLTDGKTYYYQLSAYNDIGEGAESNIITTPLPAVTVTDIDGNVYDTVIIGTQEWLVQNLRTTKYADGTPIPNLPIAGAWIADVTGAYCWYNNDVANKEEYGALYNWYAVDNAHGLAPTGWRVPSEADVNTLLTTIAPLSNDDLKEIGLTHWMTPNTGATDTFGFSSRGAGQRSAGGVFASLGIYFRIWESDEYDATQGEECILGSYFGGNGTFEQANKAGGNSVRCMRDLTVGTTYVSYSDGVDTFRKGVRDHALVVDVALTALAFGGVEGVDWENIKTAEI
jgi:uncharacterized protein (TIGR02145 family)